jgi:quercetin 2,3-dioxygenase
MGNTGVIRQNDVQIMSAGTGIQHSEYNKNKDKLVNFLQIWVFPKKKNIKPRYDQKTLKPEERMNRLQVIVSPDDAARTSGADEAGVKINQDAWFNLGTLTKGTDVSYQLHAAKHGVYVFVIEGDVKVNGLTLNKRDGLGVWDTDRISLTADSNVEVLLIEVPMLN